MKNNKALICVTVKNEEKNLPKFLKVIKNISKLFEEVYYIFVISNSKDKSEKIVRTFINRIDGKVIVKNFENNNRLLNLEISRNQYIEFIRQNKIFKNFKYMMVMDVDGVNELLNYEILKSAINSNIKWNALFANQYFFYYDLFALRIKNEFDEDCFEFLLRQDDKKVNLKKYFKENIFDKYQIISKKNERYISVTSAFGGLGIYKLDKVLNSNSVYNSYAGTQCEHVAFNKNINEKFNLFYVDKNLINSNGLNKHILNAFLCSRSNFFLKRFINNLRK